MPRAVREDDARDAVEGTRGGISESSRCPAVRREFGTNGHGTKRGFGTQEFDTAGKTRADSDPIEKAPEKRELLVNPGVCERPSRTTNAPPMQALPATDGGFAPRDAEDGSWASSFASRVADLRSEGVTYEDSASFLRALTKSGILRFTDIRDRPDRFFLAHRLLARHAPEHGPGFWIRFTVQFNLFAGTVVALGGPEHLKQLDAIQDAGQLGCFGLTERLAGVNSGLVVNTTARWDPATETFIINSPNEGSAKNWISQGLCAEKAVCVANLTVGQQRCGPHAFLIDLRDPRDGRLAAGITVGDMGRKTTGNDLDNAWIEFRDVRVPKSALLNRYGDVDARAGRYVPAVEGARTMDMIGQRLFTGRVAVAQAALTFTRGLFAATRAYSDGKRCTMRGDAGQFLSDVPQLNSLYANVGTQLASMDAFVAGCEAELATCLVRRAIPPLDLTRAIAVAKIRAVETSIASCHALKQEVGSYALMAGTGFENTDFLQCCKFAEGDSRILSQKLARDAFGEFVKNKGKAPRGWSKAEAGACRRVARAVADATRAGKGKSAAWDSAWVDVYALADAVCDRVVLERTGGRGGERARL